MIPAGLIVAISLLSVAIIVALVKAIDDEDALQFLIACICAAALIAASVGAHSLWKSAQPPAQAERAP